MSIVGNYRDQWLPMVRGTHVRRETLKLVEYARSLEAMLKDVRDDVAECASFEAQYESHRPDRSMATQERLAKLDKLLDGVE